MEMWPCLEAWAAPGGEAHEQVTGLHVTQKPRGMEKGSTSLMGGGGRAGI